MIKIKQYIDTVGCSPFDKWFLELNSVAAAKVTKEIYKLELGNFSKVEGVGAGVYEQKIDLALATEFTLGRMVMSW